MTSSVIEKRPFSCSAIGHSTRPERTRAATPPLQAALGLFALLAAGLIGGCAAGDAAGPDLSRASAAHASGRWDDLSGALAAAQREHEMSILEDARPEPGVRVVTLLTVLDERVVIRASAATPGETDAPQDLSLRVSHGLWGDAEEEAAIIQTIRRSLERQARLREGRR